MAAPPKSQLVSSWSLNNSWKFVRFKSTNLRIILGKNFRTLIDNFLVRALKSLAASFPTVITDVTHPSIVLLITCPRSGATELISSCMRICNTFVIRKIANGFQIIKFYPIHPHFSFGIEPLVPWIWSIKKMTTNGNVQNQIEFLIEGLAVFWYKY